MSKKLIRFGAFRFDADRGLLYRDGRPLALGGKAAILLRMLLEARGDVVLKSDLMDAAWPCPTAEISNLTVQITALRRCLGDDSRCPKWIETLHGVGYRFAGDIEIEDGRAAVRPNLTIPDRPLVALLPFQLSGGASLHPHVVDGFHEKLLAELSRLPVLIMTIGKHANLAELPSNIRACDYWIGGQVGIRQTDLRIEATIYSRRSGNLGVSIFKRDLSELFRLQAELADQVMSRLSEVLSKSSAQDKFRRVDVVQRYYDRGCRLMVRSHAGNRCARLHLSKAVGLDPGFARAQAFLGLGHYTAAIHYGEDVRANRALALAYANNAVALASEDSTARGALGFVQLYDGRLAEAEDSLLAARHYDPSDTFAWMNLSELRVFQGRHEDATAIAKKAIREHENPPSSYYWILAFGHYATGRYSEAVEALSRPEIGMLPGKRILSASLAQLGYLREARLEAGKFLAAHPEFSISGWSETQPFMYRGDRQHFIDGLIKAGLPE
jgi:DNA-binding winged helix-turn-helix (wHTH) protein/tetratricopeptide (TPR) repeat protein